MADGELVVGVKPPEVIGQLEVVLLLPKQRTFVNSKGRRREGNRQFFNTFRLNKTAVFILDCCKSTPSVLTPNKTALDLPSTVKL